ncbi:MAG: hypothetical protein AB1374_06155 [Bacillota bacterium]
MLERCADLAKCERVLSATLKGVTFLGQVGLSAEDTEKLGLLIREQIKQDIRQGTQFLKDNAPTCLSLFLVGAGVWRYREGNYWSAVSELVGLDDVNWQIKWGKIFLDFLARKGFPQFDLEVESEDSRRYVTPILLHGGIPQSCLDEFFGSIVRPMIDDDLIDADEIKDRLFWFRKQEGKLRELRTEIRSLSKEEETLSQELKNLDKLMDLKRKAEELSPKAAGVEQYEDLPEDCAGFLRAKEDKLEKVKSQIAKLEKQRRNYQCKIEAFTESDKRVLEYAFAIERCQRDYQALAQEQAKLSELRAKEIAYRGRLSSSSWGLWQTPWNDRYGEILERLPLEQLVQKCSEYITLKESHGEKVAELSRFVISETRFSLTFWIGIPLVPAGLGLLFLPWKLLGSLTFLLGLLALADGFWRLRTGKQIESQQKKQWEILCHEVKTTEAQLNRLEAEIFQLLAGLPFPPEPSVVVKPDLVDDLKVLKEVFRQYRDCLSEKQQIELRLSEWERRVKEVAAGATGSMPGPSVDYIISILAERVSSARRNREEAGRAKECIGQEIELELCGLKDVEAKLIEELDGIRKRLLTLGRGDLEAGIQELNLKRQVYRELQEVEAAIERLVEMSGGRPAVLGSVEEIIKLRDGKAEALERVQAQLREKERELSGYASIFPNVDKPVERFLLYGGEWVEKWLVGSVNLMDQAFRERRIPVEAASGLPARVVAGFEKWWNENYPPDAPPLPDRERFSTPVLALDTQHAEIKIVIGQHRFQLADAGMRPIITLEITAFGLIGSETPNWAVQVPLRAYRVLGGWVETGPVEYSVPLAGSYEVILLVGEESRRSWQVSGLAPGTPYLAFTEEGRQITEERLPRKRLWLLVLPGYSLPSDILVIEEATPPTLEQTYGLFFVDLTHTTAFYFVDSRGMRYYVTVAESESFEPYLKGGQVITSVSVEGAPVYVGEPPTIVLPLNETGIEQWGIFVRCGAGLAVERKRYLLSDLGERVVRTENRVEIPLAIPELLGPEPAGIFTIRLRAKERKDHVFSLAVVPDLLVVFEPVLFLPVDQDGCTVGLTVIVSESARFDVDPPAEIVTVEDDAYEVSVPFTEDAVRGTLSFAQTAGDAAVTLSVKLPKVRWRLQGFANNRFSDWSCRVEELWLGDWQKSGDHLFLELDLPPDAGERVELHLYGSSQLITEPLRRGVARFNVAAFADTLRNSAADLCVFGIRIYGPRRKLIQEGPLFRVRCRWMVEAVDWSLENLATVRRLRFQWQEKGEAQNRVLRLWRLWEPWAEPLVQPIPEGKKSLIIERGKDLLPPGKYLAQFDEEDPWSPGGAVTFPDNGFNTAEIEIDEGELHIKECFVETLAGGGWLITGTLANARPGQGITGLLYGIVGRKAKVWQHEGKADPEGEFELRFVPEDAADFATAHWFGVFLDEAPLVYQIGILPEPEPFEHLLADLTIEEIKEILEVREMVGIKVKIHCPEGHLDQPVLPPHVSHEVLRAWAEGENSVEVNLQMGGRTKGVRLEWSEGEVHLCLPSGVKCTTMLRDGTICGKILPNQQAWYRHVDSPEHLPGAPRSMRINYERIPVSLLLTWDFKAVIEECRRRFPLAAQDLLILYSSLNRPLPEGLSGEDIPDAERTVKLLWAKEKELTLTVLRGEPGNEH